MFHCLLLLLMFAPTCWATPEQSGFVGSKRCASCHMQEAEQWAKSHHAHSMAVASADNVLGDFSDARFEYNGRQTRFWKQGADFMVTTEGADGTDQDFRIEYTFGVHPLQQYLIRLEQGRIHALSIAWDTRKAEDGGQRWFHLYPDENVDASDPLHWTGPYQQWNSRCADCHSTGLERGFEPTSGAFDTRWAEINVGCESCHGPAETHVSSSGAAPPSIDPGARGRWAFSESSPIASLTGSSSADKQLAVCGPCHSRRTNLADIGAAPPFTDAHQPALLDPGLYQSDGQILDEVFVYGSFVQSKMYQKGVTCTDCHNPHSLTLHADGNGVCAQCHKPATFDVSSHHRHAPGSDGAQCVNCHMPKRTYMVVDPRYDHSFRVPDPWTSKSAGTTNACTQCHTDRDADWVIARFSEWGVKQRTTAPSALLARAHGTDLNALRALRQLVADTSAPAIHRATALTMMMPGSEDDLAMLAKSLEDDDPLVRYGAVRALGLVAPEYSQAMLWPMIKDPSKMVRLEALRQVAGVPDANLSQQQREDRAALVNEYIDAQRASDGLAAGPMNLAALYIAQGRAEDAQAAYRQALMVEPSLVPAWLNLADLQRATGNEAGAAKSLERALEIAPDSAAAHHALGLHLVRRQQTDRALLELEKSVSLEPANVRYAYVYAIALQSTGRVDEAVRLIEARRRSGAVDIPMLQLLLSIYQQAGDVDGVRNAIGAIRALDAATKQ